MANFLEKQLSDYLRECRGQRTFSEFSRKIGLPSSTLHRLEQWQQSITLRNLQLIMSRLNCQIHDIFPIGKNGNLQIPSRSPRNG